MDQNHIEKNSYIAFTAQHISALVPQFRETTYIARDTQSGAIGISMRNDFEDSRFSHIGTLPPIYPEWLGDRAFGETHSVRFPYIAGEMANGIATAAMVIAMSRAEMLGFFGSAGLGLDRIAGELAEIRKALGPLASWGANLIHIPDSPEMECEVVKLFIDSQVTRVSASAFMRLTPSVVWFACHGLQKDPTTGQILRKNHLFAKISRPEVARQFMSPAPADMLALLVNDGRLTAAEAALAAFVPVAEDLTVESDSGGHTDNRPLASLFPTIATLRDELTTRYRYGRPPRLGAAGGLGTPSAVASAFALGAAYVMTGSVNQASCESGLSLPAKEMLAQADPMDVAMAPSGDMFEQGVRVQVLKRGTMFAVKAQRLYELYKTYDGLHAIPASVINVLERDYFHQTVDAVWEQTCSYFAERDPAQITTAEHDPRHRMALLFRWYLGQSSRWAIKGTPERRLDYQIWCGPAQGSFNAWVAGTCLEPLATRGVVAIALNLLEGATLVTRAQQLRSFGVPVPAQSFQPRPRPLS